MDVDWQGIITSVVTISVIGYLTTKAVYEQKQGNLKFGVFIKGLGILCLILTVIPLYVLVSQNYQVEKPGETTALYGLIVGFGFFAVYALGEGFLVRGTFDATSIALSTPWTGLKQQNFEDLVSVSFNVLCYWYVLKFQDGTKIRISSYLGGNGHLLDLLRAKGYDI